MVNMRSRAMDRVRVSEDIVPLSEFKARAAEWLRKAACTGAPIVITQNGRAAAVLLSPREYDALTERVRFLEAVAEGLRDVDAGRVVDHQSMVAEMTARYGSTDE
jgi:prevent-host-death family protein